MRNPPAKQETWVRSLGREDPLEKEVATLQYTCLRKSHRQRSLVGYSPWGWKESDLHMHAMETVLLPECFAYLLGSFAY